MATRHTQALAAVAGASLLLGGCTQLGPGLMKAGRNEYNVAVAQTSDEQFVLNIVRMRYADNPMWLDVGSVTTQFTFSQGASAEVVRDTDFLRYGPRVGADVRYSETPTISYTPVTGEQYAKNLLAAMGYSSFMLMANRGWAIDRLLRLVANRMNGLPNAPEAVGPTPVDAPQYAQFRRAAELLRALQKKDMLRFRFQDPGVDSQPAMYIREQARDWPETRELRELLGLRVDKLIYDLHILADNPHPDSIGIDLRSLAEIANFLSTSVEVPAEDEAAGRVTVTLDEDGEPFDWTRVVGGLFRIRSASEQPTEAVVAVRYRGAWFYIDDRDIQTKYTFRLIDQLGDLLAGNIEKGPAPVLTLPVGGG